MVEIRLAKEADIDIIRQLAFDIWPDAYGEILSPDQLSYMLNLIYSKEALLNQLKNLHHYFILIYQGETAVGFASYSPKTAGNNETFRLHKLYVLPNQQGKGTGKALLNYIITDIKQSGAKMLELNVNRHNKALHFYNKIGFTISKEEDIDIGSGYFMNDYVMSYEL